MRNYRAIVEYDGTEYAGFQIQADRATIQGALEQSLTKLGLGHVRIHGAGRTDAGVHALGQVIHFQTDWRHGSDALERGMNAVLDRAIAVRQVAPVSDAFHARYSARRRMYVYRAYTGRSRSPLLDRFACHIAGKPNLVAMSEAASLLVGEHDFAAFGQAPWGENTVREVHRAGWREVASDVAVGAPAGWPHLFQFEIEANAFLRGMVRRIVGTLLEVGCGRRSVQDVAEVLAAREISHAGVQAPASGLHLWRVEYDAMDWVSQDEKEHLLGRQ
ncbi:MAG: tRNA pseudouridine(38-40) synthase TruA [Anaerolineae bacterium]